MGCKGSWVRIPPPRPIDSTTWATLRSGPSRFWVTD